MTTEEIIYHDFVNNFSNILREKVCDLEISQLIFLCVGTDRVIGDSFGPLVGYKLNQLFFDETRISIIGNLQNTVSSNNIQKVIHNIEIKYENPFIIAIDAALSNNHNIGEVIVSGKKMNIGRGLYKKSTYIGDISIKGIVARNYKNSRCNFRILQNTSLNFIMNMANLVSKGIYNVINV